MLVELPGYPPAPSRPKAGLGLVLPKGQVVFYSKSEIDERKRLSLSFFTIECVWLDSSCAKELAP